MRTIERVMRVMTQVNIGAAIGMVAWVAASGYQVMSGELKVPHVRPVAPSQGEPAKLAPVNSSCCLVPAQAAQAPTLQAQATSAVQVALLDRGAP